MFFGKLKILALAGALIAGYASAVEAGSVTFSDGVFLNTNWDIGFPQQNLSGFPKFTGAGQQNTNGNPDQWRRVFANMPCCDNFIYLTNYYKTAYDPATAGAITSLRFAYDVKYDGDDGRAFQIAPGLIQNNDAYYARSFFGLVGSTLWTSAPPITGLTALNFDRVDTLNTYLGVHPDFSASGAPIYFGFTFLATSCCATETPGGIDNWRVDITNAADVATPLPAALPLFASGLAGLGWIVRRRRKHATA